MANDHGHRWLSRHQRGSDSRDNHSMPQPLACVGCSQGDPEISSYCYTSQRKAGGSLGESGKLAYIHTLGKEGTGLLPHPSSLTLGRYHPRSQDFSAGH